MLKLIGVWFQMSIELEEALVNLITMEKENTNCSRLDRDSPSGEVLCSNWPLQVHYRDLNSTK